MNVINLLEFEEGYREKAYYCSEGYPTIGIGTKIGPKGAPLDHYVFTVSREAAGVMLLDELDSVTSKLESNAWYVNLNESRKAIIKSMCYQMGYSGVMKFKNMINALERKDYEEAASQMLDSRWSRQTPQRSNRHAEVMKSGDIDDVYGGLM